MSKKRKGVKGKSTKEVKGTQTDIVGDQAKGKIDSKEDNRGNTETVKSDIDKETVVKIEKKTEDKTTEVKTEKAEPEKKPATKTIDINTEPEKAEETPAEPKKVRSWTPVLVAGILVLVLIGVHFGVAHYYRDKFLPHTMINGMDVANQTIAEVADSLEQSFLTGYSLTVTGRDGEELTVIRTGDVNMTSSVDDEVRLVMEKQDPNMWIIAYLGGGQGTTQIEPTAEYDEELLEQHLEELGFFDVEEEILPENAYIGEYQPDEKQFVIVPEVKSNILDEEAVLAAIKEAVDDLRESVNIELCYAQPDVKSDDAALVAQLEQMNKMVGTSITYDWNGTEEILDGDLIQEWISLEDEKVVLDEEKVSEYVSKMAKAYDTYGRNRDFVTYLGVELTLPSGGFGWRTNRSEESQILTDLIKEGTVTEREPEYSVKGWTKGKNDIGDSFVEIDMTNQHLYLHMEGEVVLETDFVSGDVSEGNTTPAGVFGITYKTKEAVLRGAEYESHVHYWMPFNGNIGMHDATWRRTFGGDIYLTNGSHGCINLPLGKAAEIYEYMEQGFPVVCYYYPEVVAEEDIAEEADVADTNTDAEVNVNGDDQGS